MTIDDTAPIVCSRRRGEPPSSAALVLEGLVKSLTEDRSVRRPSIGREFIGAGLSVLGRLKLRFRPVVAAELVKHLARVMRDQQLPANEIGEALVVAGIAIWAGLDLEEATGWSEGMASVEGAWMEGLTSILQERSAEGRA